jgi:hypothetical protein
LCSFYIDYISFWVSSKAPSRLSTLYLSILVGSSDLYSFKQISISANEGLYLYMIYSISPKFYIGNIDSGLVSNSPRKTSLYALCFSSYCLKSLGSTSWHLVGSKNSSTNSFCLIFPTVTSSVVLADALLASRSPSLSSNLSKCYILYFKLLIDVSICFMMTPIISKP